MTQKFLIEEMASLSIRYIVLTIILATQSEIDCTWETVIHLTSVFKQNTFLNSVIVFGGIMKFWYQLLD